MRPAMAIALQAFTLRNDLKVLPAAPHCAPVLWPLEDMMSRRRILLVEDEPLICLDIEMTLGQLGHEVSITPTVREALARVEGGEVDLAILDYYLQDTDTTAVAARLRQANIPFIVCSGSFAANELDAVFAGARVLAKPFSTEGLIDAVVGATPLDEEKTA